MRPKREPPARPLEGPARAPTLADFDDSATSDFTAEWVWRCFPWPGLSGETNWAIIDKKEWRGGGGKDRLMGGSGGGVLAGGGATGLEKRDDDDDDVAHGAAF